MTSQVDHCSSPTACELSLTARFSLLRLGSLLFLAQYKLRSTTRLLETDYYLIIYTEIAPIRVLSTVIASQLTNMLCNATNALS